MRFTGIPDGDANGNGYTNFQEYAFGSTGNVPQGSLQTLTVAGIPAVYQTLTFRFNSLAADAFIEAESSDDLLTWAPGYLVLHSRTDNPDGTVNITLRAPQPWSAVLENRKFHRVRVDRSP
jgi:hypothetical protein